MDAVFPIAQREGDAYHTLSDFTKLFDQAKSGRYLIGQGYGWHSGVHLTSKMLPWGKGLRPIQAMLDGKIVAFRIHSDYQVATYQDQEFKYSNNFVLIEHEAVNPEDSEDVFKFHTLYMHLAPPSDIGANSSITTRYRLQEARNVRTFKHSDVPTNSGEKKQSMSKGTLLEYLYAEEKETHPYQIGKNTYKMIKCRVVENGESPNGGEKAMLNKIVWFASGLNSDFDILQDSSAVLSEPVSEPKWMSDNAAMIRDGSVVSLHTTLFSGGIKVSAGEDIGYMGLQEYSNDAIGTKKDDNRVHIEMFSFEEPPEFFKKQISPKNAEENPLVILDGTDSSGAVDMSNSFIKQLLESVTEDQVTDFSSFTARDAKVYLDGKRKHFERFIVKHPTDWHTESSQSLYESIHQTAKEALDIKCSAGFVTEEDYRNSPWRAQVMDSFDLFSQFELERADKFSWMQDLQGDLQLSGDKSLWHYWPFTLNIKKLSKCKLSIDHEFIGELEGSRKKGYVPDPENSKSGVTIATGFDLGARNVVDLKKLGLPSDLITKLTPYLGMKKFEAESFLKKNPLTINENELLLINHVVKKHETEKIIALYNKNSQIEFACLPSQAQTVIASVAYQYGYLPRETRRFWFQAVNQKWEEMYDNLMDFRDLYPTRREKEALLLKEIIE
ncbi:pesticin C-terminus-like muramidase [Vibrio owensii]|uniref:pesticin C-terminus-like muramidase n=1 Tax=Vibrio owensii TaxID=696485 RepID=UPI003394C63A